MREIPELISVLRTQFQPTLLQDMPNGMVTLVRSLCISAQGELRTVATGDFNFQDRKFLCEDDIFGSGCFVAFANHVYCITHDVKFEKVTMKKQGLVMMPKASLTGSLKDFKGVRRVIGVDVDGENFFLSCQIYRYPWFISVFKCSIVGKDDLAVEHLSLPSFASKLWAKRMIYREDSICILTTDSEIFICEAGSDSLNWLPPADNFKPKYLQIARRENRLYVFDYSECPVHLHDFSQPFSHFDKIRVYDLTQKNWIAHYPVDMNKLRQSGYNELMSFKIDMYFIREQLYFLWTYQDRLHIFRLNEEAGCTEHLFNYEVPGGANGVILLPGYFNLHGDSTVLEKFMNSYCLKRMEFFGENRENARKVAEWAQKYFDGVVGSGLIPFEQNT